MIKALGSKIDLNNLNVELSLKFNDAIADLLEQVEIQNLDNYSQHLNTSRFQHSINVAYYSFLLAEKLNLDSRSTARGALLHDLFFYNWKDTDFSGLKHAVLHPFIALENSKKITSLNEIEEDIIKKHMWPMTFMPPKYKESMLVSFVDKYCSVFEVAASLSRKVGFAKA